MADHEKVEGTNVLDLRYQQIKREGEEYLKHMQTFKLDVSKVSAGIWFFTPGGGRFHLPYVEEKGVAERLEIAQEMKEEYGLKGISAHYPWEINEENFELYQKSGLKLVCIGPGDFREVWAEFGTFSNPIKRQREKALNNFVSLLKLAKQAEAEIVVVWPGIDGYTYHLHDYRGMWDRFEGAVAEALDEVPGVMIAIEPKPYEPAPNNIYRTTADGILLARDIEARLRNPVNKKLLAEGHHLVGLNPEKGHVSMGFEYWPYILARISREGRLAHTHWNSQPLGNYDQDLDIGVGGDWQETEAGLYELKKVGYRGWFELDINPERVPAKIAVKNCILALQIMNERIEKLPHERIAEAINDPENHRGVLEQIIIESMK